MRVSICSSVKDQSSFLGGCIKSVVDQTFKDWELVIVDDGSTEDIKSIIEGFKDERIKYHRFQENKGIPHGINWAFENSTGEYVQPLAADEILDPNKLEEQVKLLDENKDIQAVCGLPQLGIVDAPMGKRPNWEQYVFKAQNRSREQWMHTFLNLDYVPIGSCSSLFRREVFNRIGYFREDLQSFVDHEWWVRFLEVFTLKMYPYRWAKSLPNPGAVSLTQKDGAKELEKVRELHPQVYTPKTKVTIGVPCKDMARFLKATIQSVLNQTHKDFELRIVDDGSTDDPMSVVKEFNDPRIKLTILPENKGQQEALNYALAVAEGDYFVPLSADDTIEPTFLKKCVDIFNLNPCLEYVGSQTDFIHEDGSPYTEDHIFKHIEKATNRTQDQWKEKFRLTNIYHGAGMIRTQALKEIGGFNKSSGVLSDYEVYLKLIFRFDRYIIEEDLTHTRIHSKNQSSAVDQKWLRLKYFELTSEFYPPRKRLIIATPFYESRGYAPYIASMMNTVRLLMLANVEWEFWEISGDAYVDRAKNTIMNKFLEDPRNTDLFMIDSDMSWDPTAFMRILTFPEEIVAGSYPMKNAWKKWTSTPFVEVDKEDSTKVITYGRRLESGGTLIQGRELSGGFVRYKREALEKYKETFKTLPTYKDIGADPANPDREYFNFFHCDVHDGMRWGEDRVFSRRMNEAGMQWWIYTDINFGHYGVTGYHGNFHEYLQESKSGAHHSKAS